MSCEHCAVCRDLGAFSNRQLRLLPQGARFRSDGRAAKYELQAVAFPAESLT
jgi:hypothetical protein